jgi:gamma-glutamylcyclotransferase (GGCT)/AIG2-like uncharacterized protein YtfP
MDNTRDLPGYKYYVDARTGDRPAVCVAYVALEPDPETTVNGVVFPVERAALTALDDRERSYARREVTGQIDPPTGGRTWAYFARPDARDRARRSNVVINRRYHDAVREGFAALGPEQLAAFEDSTDAPPVPMRDLRRVELLAKPPPSP